MKNQEFDDIIKKLFENYQANQDPANWESLDHRLDKDDALESEAFDSNIKEQFANYVPPASTPNWSRMNELLDKEDASKFDRELKEKVEHYEAPYDSKSWPVLHTKLATREWMHRHLLNIKALEIVAVTLLFFSFFNYFSREEAPLPAGPFAENHSSSKSSDSRLTDKHYDPITDTKTIQDSPIATADTEASLADIQQAGGVVTDQARNSNVSGNNQGSDRLTTPFIGQNRATDQSGHILIENSSLNTGMPGFAEYMARSAAGLIAAIEPSIADEYQNSLLELRNAGITTDLRPIAFSESVKPFLNIQKTKIYLSLSGATDINSLLIPRDYFFSLGQAFSFTNQVIVAAGNSAGAAVSFERGRVGFETGIYYAYKSYQPDRVLQIGREFDRSTLDFESISLNIASVPAHVRYTLDQRGKWNFYAMAGIEMHVLTDARYDLLTKNYFASIAPGPNTNGPSFYEEVQRVKEDVLDGAEFKSKSFFTANSALGVERTLNSKFSAFFQPTYQHHLKLLSSDEVDQKELKSLSFRIGLRTQLK